MQRNIKKEKNISRQLHFLLVEGFNIEGMGFFHKAHFKVFY